MESTSPGLRILLVEDDLDFAYTVADSLRINGHEVTVAATGGSALAISRLQTHDAVLIDLGLPDGHGFDVVRTLRTGTLPPESVIVVITGLEVKRLEEADAIGIDLVLAKPVSAEHLSDLITYLWRRRQSRGPARPS